MKKKTFRYQELPFMENCVEKPLKGKTWGEVIKNAGLVYAPYVIYSDDKVLHFPECQNENISGEAITITLNIQGGAVKLWESIKDPTNAIMATVDTSLLLSGRGSITKRIII